MWWPIYIINSVNYNKITLLYSPTDAAPQYLSNLPPSFICQLVSQIIRQTVSQSVSPIDSQLDTLPVRDLVSQLDCHQTNQSPHPVSEPISHLSMQGTDTLVSQLASQSLSLSSKAFSWILTKTTLRQYTTQQFKKHPLLLFSSAYTWNPLSTRVFNDTSFQACNTVPFTA